MNELIDLKRFWEKLVAAWRNNLGAVLLVVLAFFAGVAWATKSITDDCKFARAFRDGAAVFDCSMRLVR